MTRAGQFISITFSVCRLTGILTCLLLICPVEVSAKNNKDTVFVHKGDPLLFLGKIYFSKKDTFFVRQKSYPGDVQHSKVLYDSVYRKFNRSKFSKFIYTLAFNAPAKKPISDTAQVQKSESPFKKYQGKIIRRIHIVSLDPFGPSTEDTNRITRTFAGQFLNSVHKKSNTYVIRNNLLIKHGEKVDPDKFADNERHLRDLPYINEARTIITNAGNDSVDVIIITQDVWSIGFDFLSITPSSLRMRIYDANFLGTGNRLSVNFSTDIKRGPFFLLDGASYQFSNIKGSFIDFYGTFSQNINGDQTIAAGFQRTFFSNRTKWAGGISNIYRKWISDDDYPKTAYFNAQNLWGGYAWFLEKENRPTRIVVLTAMNRTGFTSRPVISIDSNQAYYNTIQLFPGIAYSRNNYYNSDYLVEFGRIENIPYGNLFQINFGPEWTDYYTRFYTGFEFSGGNFFKPVGYLSLSLKGGGYFYKNAAEDEIIKVTGRYITPIFVSKNKKYKVRSFLTTDFRMAFNQRTNNKDFYNINDVFDIDRYNVDSIFYSNKGLSFTLSSILYTPWYFYGFKFGLVAQVQGGWWAVTGDRLLEQPFYFGSGFGIMTKNNNLIFPTIIFSVFYYPEIIHGITPFQFRFIPDVALQLPDFNPRVPGRENLQN